MDVGIVRALGSPDGRAILRSLPPYDEREVMRLQDVLRRDGHAPELVAALLTQQRLQARAAASDHHDVRIHAGHRRRSRADMASSLAELATDEERIRLRLRALREERGETQVEVKSATGSASSPVALVQRSESEAVVTGLSAGTLIAADARRVRGPRP